MPLFGRINHYETVVIGGSDPPIGGWRAKQDLFQCNCIVTSRLQWYQ